MTLKPTAASDQLREAQGRTLPATTVVSSDLIRAAFNQPDLRKLAAAASTFLVENQSAIAAAMAAARNGIVTNIMASAATSATARAAILGAQTPMMGALEEARKTILLHERQMQEMRSSIGQILPEMWVASEAIQNARAAAAGLLSNDNFAAMVRTLAVANSAIHQSFGNANMAGVGASILAAAGGYNRLSRAFAAASATAQAAEVRPENFLYDVVVAANKEMNEQAAGGSFDLDQYLNIVLPILEAALRFAKSRFQRDTIVETVSFIIAIWMIFATPDLTAVTVPLARVEAAMERVEEKLDKAGEALATIQSRLLAIEKVQSPAEGPAANARLRLISTKPAWIRTEPNRTSAVKDRLDANEVVEVLGTSQGWVHIRYSDYLNSSTSEGWVSRRVLRKLAAGGL